MQFEERPSLPIWKSYVYHGDKCFFVSTIDRTYETYAGYTRGCETLVWEYDDIKRERGEMIGHMGSVVDHQRICRCLIAEGVMLDENNEAHQRFLKE
jgi:hypothetical protein